MRHTRCLFLFSLLFLGGMSLLNSSSQHVFAAYHNVKTYTTLLYQDPNNYVQGYMDGYQSGYSQGLDACTLRNIQSEASAYSASLGSPTRYEIGETKGYSRGFSKGDQDCQEQLQRSQPQPEPIPPGPFPTQSGTNWP